MLNRVQLYSHFIPFVSFTVPEVFPNITEVVQSGDGYQITWVFTDDPELWNDHQFSGFHLRVQAMFPTNVDVPSLPTYTVDSSTFTLITDRVDYFDLYTVVIDAFTSQGSGVSQTYCFSTVPFCKYSTCALVRASENKCDVWCFVFFICPYLHVLLVLLKK